LILDHSDKTDRFVEWWSELCGKSADTLFNISITSRDSAFYRLNLRTSSRSCEENPRPKPGSASLQGFDPRAASREILKFVATFFIDVNSVS
jgi:hypothetical protein